MRDRSRLKFLLVVINLVEYTECNFPLRLPGLLTHINILVQDCYKQQRGEIYTSLEWIFQLVPLSVNRTE